jgi:ABC-type antimicrobial peptide transport system permease subunit
MTGLNAVVAGRVARRRRELAVHAALGATPRALMRVALLRTLVIMLAASAAGTGAAIGGSRWLASQIPGAVAVDLATIGGVLVSCLTIGTIAAIVPARRAALVDPMTILRAE